MGLMEVDMTEAASAVKGNDISQRRIGSDQ
jgi:hypothetical protein